MSFPLLFPCRGKWEYHCSSCSSLWQQKTSSFGGSPQPGRESLISCWIRVKVWPQSYWVTSPCFDHQSTELCKCWEQGVERFFFLIFFCVSRRKWKSEVIFSPLIVWSCSIELDGYSHILLNGSRISNNCFPLEYHSVSGFPFCGDVSVSWTGSCRLIVIRKRTKRSNEKIITFLHTSGKSDNGSLVPDANGEPSAPGLSPEAVQNIWRGLYHRSYSCVQVQEKQGSFSSLRNLLFPANRALQCCYTAVVEFVCPNRQRSQLKICFQLQLAHKTLQSNEYRNSGPALETDLRDRSLETALETLACQLKSLCFRS